MCVVGIRHPGAWTFGLLTKVTPGVMLFWYLARLQWRPVLVIASVTLAISAVSYFTLPEAWRAWIGLLTESSTRTEAGYATSDWPAVFRLPIAAGLMVMASWRSRPAAIPVILCFALPAVWLGGLTLLAAIPRLTEVGDVRAGKRQPAVWQPISIVTPPVQTGEIDGPSSVTPAYVGVNAAPQ
jgi:hypothetical protein